MLDEAASGVDAVAAKAERFVSSLITIALIVLTLGVGYYGYKWYKKRQEKGRIGSGKSTISQNATEVEFATLGGRS